MDKERRRWGGKVREDTHGRRKRPRAILSILSLDACSPFIFHGQQAEYYCGNRGGRKLYYRVKRDFARVHALA
jgi:hypothetical protein